MVLSVVSVKKDICYIQNMKRIFFQICINL